uniref:Uncharacterized protein n=1 Tax=Oryzias latipes TaxID=8090 RepID=A0A3P9K9K8_ORYLA
GPNAAAFKFPPAGWLLSSKHYICMLFLCLGSLVKVFDFNIKISVKDVHTSKLHVGSRQCFSLSATPFMSCSSAATACHQQQTVIRSTHQLQPNAGCELQNGLESLDNHLQIRVFCRRRGFLLSRQGTVQKPLMKRKSKDPIRSPRLAHSGARPGARRRAPSDRTQPKERRGTTLPWPTTRWRPQKWPVQCGSRGQVSLRPKPRSWNLAFGTWNVLSLGGKEPELV